MKQTEYELQCQCVQYLEVLKAQKKVLFFSAIPNSTYTKSWTVKRKNTLSGVRSGLPDLFVSFPHGNIFIELKTQTGTLQTSQKEAIKAINASGLGAFICASFDEFKLLIDHGINGREYPQEYFDGNGKGSKMLKKLKEKN